MRAHKLRQDFQLALVVMFGFITNVIIIPFAVFRFFDGQVLAGAIDTIIVASISICAWHAYRRGSTEHVALLLAAVYSSGCIAIAFVAGPAGPLWLYAAMLANFLLVKRKRAAVISAIGVAAVAASPLALPELVHKAAFIGSSVVVCAFAYVFAWRTDLQRRQLEDLALLDPLTGATNRRGMNAELEIAMATSSRNGQPLGLIIFDLDHFKGINDRFGHDAGDNVLIQVASVVRKTTRKNDRFFRLGGEEFALLIPDAEAAVLLEIAEKIRLAIQRDVHCGATTVTTSLGASILRSGETAGEWRARADAAMYRAKHNGRNCVVVDDLESADQSAQINPANDSPARACAGNPMRAGMDADARSNLASLHILGARAPGSQRPHDRQAMVDPHWPHALALAVHDARGPTILPLAVPITSPD